MSELLKVLIVDDEHLVRSLLRNCINWNEIGYEVVGEASNAHEALDLVEELRPDVIFTDIYMPFMDGLEFGKIVFEKYSNIKIVVLTGHEEFEYAKRSIKIGIADFLLKPINDDEIRKVAINLKQKIESERDHQEEYTRIKKQLEENLPYLRERFLNQLLQSSFEIDDIMHQLDYFKIKINPEHMQVAVIEASLPDMDEFPHEEELLMLNMKCYDLITKFFRQDELVHIFRDNNRNIVILSCEKSIDFSECLESLRTMLINKLKCAISAGMGGIYTGLARIKNSYKEAMYALNYKIIAGKNQVISYNEINFSNPSQPALQNDNFDTLAFYLKAGMQSKTSEFIENILLGACENSNMRIESIRALASNVISIIINVLTEIEINLSDIFSNSSQPFERIFMIDTLPEMKDYLLSVAGKAINSIQSTQTRKVSQIVEKVKEHIQQNMTDPDLSLSNTARKFYMNMSYLSRIFKQETGYTFVEYLTKVRMEKAVKLLKETDLKAYQIAEEVGITNPHYFGICFKKWTGLSINDFKKAELEKVK